MKTFLITILSFLIISTNLYAQNKASLKGKSSLLQDKLNTHKTNTLPSFEYNQGQIADEVQFRLSTPTACVDFYADKVTFSSRKISKEPDYTSIDPKPEFEYVFWEVEFVEASGTGPTAEGGLKETNVNYFTKNASRIDQKKCDEIVYKDLYPNIDLRFYLTSKGQLKYDFILHPGALVSDVKMRYNGIEELELREDGSMQFMTEWGPIKEEKPYSYVQEDKTEINVNYTLNGQVLSFSYETDQIAKTIVIDPIYVDWSTYLYGEGYASTGGYAWTWILDLDIDDSLNVYVTGMTSDRFITYGDYYDTSRNGYYDAFICKMTADGDSIIYFNYIGGSSYEYAFAMTVNGSAEPVIAGIGWSQDFPITSGAFQETRSSGYYYQGYVTKLNSAGDSLIFSTYLGGSSNDLIHSLALDAGGNVYVTGQTTSNDFPTTSGCFDNSYNGGTITGGWGWPGGDIFLAKLNASGTALLYGSYIGGAEVDVAFEIQLSPSNEIYLVGKTASGNFPVTPGSTIFNYNVRGPGDGFIMKFKTDMKTLVYSKMMGGDGDDWFEGVYINDADEAYVAGVSNSNNFYTTSNAFQKSNGGGYDIVVVKMNKLGQNVYYSTYMGGNGDEKSYSYWIFTSNVRIAANVRDEAIICGTSASSNFPVTNDALMKNNPSSYSGSYWNTSATISKLDFSGSKLLYGTYYGGSGFEIPGANKLKRVSCYTNILYGGLTSSSDYPTTPGAFRESKSSSSTGYFWTGFISKFRDTLYTDLVKLSNQDTILECDNVFEILDAKNQGADILWNDGFTERARIVTEPGTYWVRATYGCDTVRDTIHIILEYSPKMPALPSDSIYCDQFPDITLDAKNDTIMAGYLWYSGDTSQTKDINSEGKYWVTISTPNCGSKTDTVQYTLLQSPQANLPEDSVFCDEVGISLTIGTGTNQEEYYWSTGDSLSSVYIDSSGVYWAYIENFCGIDSAAFESSVLYTPEVLLPSDSIFCNSVNLDLSIGMEDNEEYYLWLNINNSIVISFDDTVTLSEKGLYVAEISNKCGISRDTIDLGLYMSPELDLGPDSIFCDEINYLLSAGNEDNGESYEWNDGSSASSLNINLEGDYWLEINNKCGTISDSIHFTKKLSPGADIFSPGAGPVSDSVFCDELNIVLDAQISDPEATYLWSTGSVNNRITVTEQNLYWVQISAYCGSSRDSVDLQLLFSPTPEIGDDRTFCGNMKSFNLVAGNGDNEEIYLWSDGSTGSSFEVKSPGQYWVQVQNKCGNAADSLSVRISEYPIVNLGKDTTLCGNFKLLLDAGNSGMSYLWEPGGETSQSIVASEQKLYRVFVSNVDGCTSADELEIRPDCISHIHIPTAFSPNHDNINDTYKPVLVNFENYTLQIYDRWGELLFETHDINQGWDGTFLGRDVQQGVYLYQITFTTTEDLLPGNYSGLLHLIR